MVFPLPFLNNSALKPLCACPVAQSHPALCDPVVYSPPGSSVHGIVQARILERGAIPPTGDLPNPGIDRVSYVSCIGRQIFFFFFFTTLGALGKPLKPLGGTK